MKKQLDPKTPKWFEIWHSSYFMPTHDRTKRNEKWIYIIVAAIIASGIAGRGYTDELAGFIQAILEAL